MGTHMICNTGIPTKIKS